MLQTRAMTKRVGLSQRVVVCGSERRDCLDQAWTQAVAAEGNLPIPLGNATIDVAGLLDALTLDAIVLTGGNDIASAPGAVDVAPERDRFERAALAWAHDRDIPVLGVCRGLQMLATEAGATLAETDGHVATRHALVSTIAGLPSGVNSFHRLSIVDAPAQVESSPALPMAPSRRSGSTTPARPP
jgi:putative glutamine amidotransferase